MFFGNRNIAPYLSYRIRILNVRHSSPACAPLLSLSIRLSLLREKFVPAFALVDIVPTISSHTRALFVPSAAVAPGNLILFEAPPKMPPSALISVHTVGCAWRLLMCYVNTLPKCRRAAVETSPACPFREAPTYSLSSLLS